MLKIQFKDRRKPALWLVDSTLKIGADPSCDIRVDEPGVDSEHVALDISQEGIILRNVSQRRSVFVNEVPIVNQEPLKAWDVIRLGSTELEIIDPLKERPVDPENPPVQATVVRPVVSPWMLKALSAPLEGQYYSLNHGNVIGREETNDIVVPLSTISRKHLKVAIRKEKLYIEDLGSSNGTFVNEERIKSCELRNGDTLRLDEFTFNVVGPVTKVGARPRTIVREKVVVESKNKKPKDLTDEMSKALASQRVFLHGMTPDVQGKVFEIINVRTHLSRMLGHHLSRSEKSVSARHVYLTETEIGWEMKNDGASDGLLVNDKMQSRVILQDGDEVVVGGTRLKFQCIGDHPLNLAQVGEMPANSNTKLFALIGLLVASGIAVWLLGVF